MRYTPVSDVRAGVVLVAVLVVVSIGALVGTTLLYGASAGREVGAASVRLQQSRMAAWSGVQAVAAELAEQRDELLRGGSPRLTRAWRLGTAEGGGVAVYRIVMQGEEVVVSEAGRLDANTVPADVLAKAPGVGEGGAERIVAGRSGRPFLSVVDVMEELTRAEVTAAPSRAGASAGGDGSGDATTAADVLTVFSFDPNVQAGIGPRGSQARGRSRIAVIGELTEEVERELGARLDRRGVEIASGLFRKGRRLGSYRAVVGELIEDGVPAAEWGPVLDAIGPADMEGDEAFVRGRVDINHAPAEVLACIPGIDAAAAEQIVERRGTLGADERASPAWPVVAGILTPRQFAEAADLLTARTLQWRVVVEGGRLIEERDREPAIRIGGGGDDVGDVPEDAVLADRVVLEAVIDVAGERPRVAYLRDVTWLPVAGVLAQRRSAIGEEGEVAGMRGEGDDGADDQWAAVSTPVAGQWSSARVAATPRAGGAGDAAEAAESDAAGKRRATGRIGRWVGGGAGGGR